MMIEKQNPSLNVGYHGLESLILGLPSCRWLRNYVPSFSWVQRLNNGVPTISHNQGRRGPKLDHHPYTIGLWSGGCYFCGLSLSPVVQQEQVVNLTSRFRFAFRVVNFKFSFPCKKSSIVAAMSCPAINHGIIYPVLWWSLKCRILFLDFLWICFQSDAVTFSKPSTHTCSFCMIENNFSETNIFLY